MKKEGAELYFLWCQAWPEATAKRTMILWPDTENSSRSSISYSLFLLLGQTVSSFNLLFFCERFGPNKKKRNKKLTARPRTIHWFPLRGLALAGATRISHAVADQTKTNRNLVSLHCVR
jgi:hypothetical protein